MRKLVFLICSAVIGSSLGIFADLSRAEDWEDPEYLFSVEKLRHNKMTIEWIRVNDVQAACEKESHNRGNGGFKIALQACSFWVGNACVLITGKKASLHSLGHEVRHCFQGAYH